MHIFYTFTGCWISSNCSGIDFQVQRPLSKLFLSHNIKLISNKSVPWKEHLVVTYRQRILYWEQCQLSYLRGICLLYLQTSASLKSRWPKYSHLIYGACVWRSSICPQRQANVYLCCCSEPTLSRWRSLWSEISKAHTSCPCLLVCRSMVSQYCWPVHTSMAIKHTLTWMYSLSQQLLPAREQFWLYR